MVQSEVAEANKKLSKLILTFVYFFASDENKLMSHFLMRLICPPQKACEIFYNFIKRYGIELALDYK
jgi:hypothetical protein